MTEGSNGKVKTEVPDNERDYTPAKLTLKMRSDSGYCCDMNCRISAAQWVAILGVIENPERSHTTPVRG